MLGKRGRVSEIARINAGILKSKAMNNELQFEV